MPKFMSSNDLNLFSGTGNSLGINLCVHGSYWSERGVCQLNAALAISFFLVSLSAFLASDRQILITTVEPIYFNLQEAIELKVMYGKV